MICGVTGNRLAVILLAAACVVAVASLVLRADGFCRDSLQVEFSTYYAAGEALNCGLSPYVNNVDHVPPIWDGLDRYRHSRFLYPPLAATLFRAFALLPYATAKVIWTILNALFVAAAIYAAAKASGAARGWRGLTLIAFAATYYPVALLLERGQIDGATMLLLALALPLAMASGSRRQFGAGLLLAAAALLKLHCVYLVPFLLVRGRWRAAVGLAVGLIALAGLTPLVSGPQATSDYLRHELPRISRWGEAGDAASLLPPDVLPRLRAGLPEQWTRQGDGVYRKTTVTIDANATLGRLLVPHDADEVPLVSPSLVSLACMACFFGIILAWQRKCVGAEPLTPLQELAYWEAVLAAILLAAPLTWAMNAVWLIPAVLVPLSLIRRGQSRETLLLVALCLFGLALAALPDPAYFKLLWPDGTRHFGAKYVLAEACVFTSLAMLVPRIGRTGSPDQGEKATL